MSAFTNSTGHFMYTYFNGPNMFLKCSTLIKPLKQVIWEIHYIFTFYNTCIS